MLKYTTKLTNYLLDVLCTNYKFCIKKRSGYAKSKLVSHKLTRLLLDQTLYRYYRVRRYCRLKLESSAVWRCGFYKDIRYFTFIYIPKIFKSILMGSKLYFIVIYMVGNRVILGRHLFAIVPTLTLLFYNAACTFSTDDLFLNLGFIDLKTTITILYSNSYTSVYLVKSIPIVAATGGLLLAKILLGLYSLVLNPIAAIYTLNYSVYLGVSTDYVLNILYYCASLGCTDPLPRLHSQKYNDLLEYVLVDLSSFLNIFYSNLTSDQFVYNGLKLIYHTDCYVENAFISKDNRSPFYITNSILYSVPKCSQYPISNVPTSKSTTLDMALLIQYYSFFIKFVDYLSSDFVGQDSILANHPSYIVYQVISFTIKNHLDSIYLLFTLDNSEKTVVPVFNIFSLLNPKYHYNTVPETLLKTISAVFNNHYHTIINRYDIAVLALAYTIFLFIKTNNSNSVFFISIIILLELSLTSILEGPEPYTYFFLIAELTALTAIFVITLSRSLKKRINVFFIKIVTVLSIFSSIFKNLNYSNPTFFSFSSSVGSNIYNDFSNFFYQTLIKFSNASVVLFFILTLSLIALEVLNLNYSSLIRDRFTKLKLTKDNININRGTLINKWYIN